MYEEIEKLLVSERVWMIRGESFGKAHTSFKIILMRTVKASDFFLSSLWPVLAPFSLFLVAVSVLYPLMLVPRFDHSQQTTAEFWVCI
jgi:hypothetical protein